MDSFASLFPAQIPHITPGVKLSEQTIRELAQRALADRKLEADCAIDSDETTSRVTFSRGDQRRTTRFSADADADLVADLVRKAAKRLDRGIRSPP